MKNDKVTAEARGWIESALLHNAAWIALHDAAVSLHGQSALTSGIGNAGNAERCIKNALRHLSHSRDACMDRSLEIWRAAGRRAPTWRRLRDEMMAVQS